jgi:hypothetical protein
MDRDSGDCEERQQALYAVGNADVPRTDEQLEVGREREPHLEPGFGM